MALPRLLIRAAQPADIEALVALNAEVQALHLPHKPHWFRAAPPASVAEWFQARLDDPTARIWIAERGGTPVGYVLVVAHNRPETPFTVATKTHEIDQLGIRADARRQGIARALVEHVIAQARRAGTSEVTLKSWSFNTDAHEAFRRLGFQVEGLHFVRPC